ncbi:hypothetical protein [Streptomyces sp. NBC_01423]|uniref:hypothetical protein n=1 Tax=Streptomyces sp. NBC_01423 TaxID=2903860 RepID=UPI002E28973D|nr:hypothetical protein [Streptomyces sp. NBC_01423]
MTAAPSRAAAPSGAFGAPVPGHQSQAAAVSRALCTGFSVVWYFADAAVQDGTARTLLGLLDRAVGHPVRVPAPKPAGADGRADVWAAGEDAADGPGRNTTQDATAYDAVPPPQAGSETVPDGSGAWDDLWDTGPPVRVAATDDRPADTTADSLLQRLAVELGTSFDPLDALLADPGWEGATVLIEAWHGEEREELAVLLRRFQNLARDSGRESARRPRLLVAARHRDLPPDLSAYLDKGFAKAVWCWNVTDRLDTAVTVASAAGPNEGVSPAGRLREELRREAVVEICGPDLACATELTGSWDGSVAGLPGSLLAVRHRVRPHEPPPGRWDSDPLGEAVTGDRPGQEGQEHWDAGTADGWCGRIRVSPLVWFGSADGGTRLNRYLWRAQNRVLLPLLDEARAFYAGLVPTAAVRGESSLLLACSRGTGRGPDGGPPRSASLELGELWYACVSGELALTPARRSRLRTLRDARNKLAHHSVLSDESLKQLIPALLER